jgi:hypothetical protein
MVPMTTLRRRFLLAFVVLVAMLAVWLGTIRWSTPTVIDGYPIGAPASCADGCPLFVDAATQWLDTAAPGHAAVDRIELFQPDYRDANGNLLLTTRSGGRDYIAVIGLADGTVRAIEVGCGVGIEPDQCFTKPPMTAPWSPMASVAGFAKARVPSQAMIHLPSRLSTVRRSVASKAY